MQFFIDVCDLHCLFQTAHCNGKRHVGWSLLDGIQTPQGPFVARIGSECIKRIGWINDKTAVL
jgi:hypothetical protein